jgi:hypothetical protein
VRSGKCDPQNCPLEKKREKVLAERPNSLLSALSRQNCRHLLAHFRAISGLFGEGLEIARAAATSWLGRQDSNLGSRDQNPMPYHLATPQSRNASYERARYSYINGRRGALLPVSAPRGNAPRGAWRGIQKSPIRPGTPFLQGPARASIYVALQPLLAICGV